MNEFTDSLYNIPSHASKSSLDNILFSFLSTQNLNNNEQLFYVFSIVKVCRYHVIAKLYTYINCNNICFIFYDY